ncbi:MAG: hypothetical protein Faunusvirus7_24 [Faunusvirus sp.]|jgi:hypothetical protein|uniref:Uncharacterized protein n=1 Tax=Faunusvirus sp. TaxID=2487766 RepID=A0A3G4ZWK4_9VIRU|nr:MAG: hypothetical protein Faunusvirus7_24 [Faunusvirus sp.]
MFGKKRDDASYMMFIICYGIALVLATELFGGFINWLDLFNIYSKINYETVKSSYSFKLFHTVIFMAIELAIVFSSILMINIEYIISAFYPTQKVYLLHYDVSNNMDIYKLWIATIMTVIICNISFYMKHQFITTMVIMLINPVVSYILVTAIHNYINKLKYTTFIDFRNTSNISNISLGLQTPTKIIKTVNDMIFSPTARAREQTRAQV